MQRPAGSAGFVEYLLSHGRARDGRTRREGQSHRRNREAPAGAGRVGRGVFERGGNHGWAGAGSEKEIIRGGAPANRGRNRLGSAAVSGGGNEARSGSGRGGLSAY